MTGRRMLPTAALVLLLMCAGLAGCFGGDDDEKKPSKVHLVWGADSTAGTVVHTMAPGAQNETQELVKAEFTFDFNETYSEEGNMATFYVDPGNGDPAVEVNANDMSLVTVSYDGHGIYRAILGANDTEGNTATTEVLVRVEYELHYDNQNEDDPYPIWFDCAPGSVEASPKRVELLSNVTNPDDGIPLLNPGGPSTVTWSVRDPGDTEVDAKQSDIPDGGEDQYGWGTNDPLAGGWRLDIDVDGDNVDTETTIWIEYESLETPVPDPPVAQE